MGLVEALLEHVSIKSVTLWVVGGLTLWHIIQRIDEHIRIKRLGNYGPTIHNWLPFGMIT